jgi:hypothetical protein
MLNVPVVFRLLALRLAPLPSPGPGSSFLCCLAGLPWQYRSMAVDAYHPGACENDDPNHDIL